MESCRICQQSGSHIKLVCRDLSILCAATSVSPLKEVKSILACQYCWKRSMQCVEFIQNVNEAHQTLTDAENDAKLKIPYAYSKTTFNITSICNERECLLHKGITVEYDKDGGGDAAVAQHNPLHEFKILIKREISDTGPDYDDNQDLIEEDFGRSQPSTSKQTQHLVKNFISEENNTIKEICFNTVKQASTHAKKQATKSELNIAEEGERAALLDPSAKKPTKGKKLSKEETAKAAAQFGMEAVVLTMEEQKKEIEMRKESERYRECLYKCAMCYLAFKRKNGYNSHMTTIHGESNGEHECEICHCRYKKASLLRWHYRRHANRWRCIRCHELIDKCQWESHNSSCEPKGNKNVYNKYPCSLCSLVFATEFRLRTHLSISHNKGSRFECDICGKKFKKKYTIAAHMSLHYVKPHDCQFCLDRFRTKFNLAQHILYRCKLKPRGMNLESRSTPQKRVCDYCSTQFDTKDALQKHIICRHLKKRQFKCDRCDKNFPSRWSLNIHVKSEHTERRRNHMCNICGSGFYELRTLQTHIEGVHERKRPYECDICKDRFGFNGALHKHRKLKHKIKPAKMGWFLVNAPTKQEDA